jgi:hypothetical protein
MSLTINHVLEFDELSFEIFSKLDPETFICCSSVCKSWESTTNKNELIRELIPEVFALFKENTKKCLSDHAVTSIDKMMMRLKKLVEKTEPLGLFSFKCVFPYNSNNVFFAKGVRPGIINETYPFGHEDFCVLMKPLTDSNHSAHYLFQFDSYLFEVKTSGIPGEQEPQITNGAFSMVEQRDYPRTYLIRRAHRKFIFLPQWQKILIVGGVAAIGIGTLAYYGGLAFCKSSYYKDSGIKKFCDFFNYKQLSLGE